MRADFAGRALRAARLDAKLYEEVEDDSIPHRRSGRLESVRLA
jgi:hypothetical protein